MTASRAVRSLKPTHLVALRAFDSRPSCLQVTAPAWPRGADSAGRLPIWSLLSHSVTHHAGRRRAWVYVEGDSILGVVVGRVRCGGLVWDVRHLWADAGREDIVQALLVRVGEDAVQRGARRVFLELPLNAPHLEMARRAGFQQYAEAALFVQAAGARSTVEPWVPRPRARRDELALFQLYTAAVPAPVRAAEAMTLEEWLALHKGTRRWSARQLGDRRQYVWETPEGLGAWVELAGSGKSQHLEWLVHPAHEAFADALVAGAVSQTQPKVQVFASCRDYQPSLRSALVRADFELVGESAVLVCQLAVRVPDRVPVAAASVRSVIGG